MSNCREGTSRCSCGNPRGTRTPSFGKAYRRCRPYRTRRNCFDRSRGLRTPDWRRCRRASRPRGMRICRSGRFDLQGNGCRTPRSCRGRSSYQHTLEAFRTSSPRPSTHTGCTCCRRRPIRWRRPYRTRRNWRGRSRCPSKWRRFRSRTFVGRWGKCRRCSDSSRRGDTRCRIHRSWSGRSSRRYRRR